MSNITHISKWNPRQSLVNSDEHRSRPKYNFHKRAPDMKKKKSDKNDAMWYHSSNRRVADGDEPAERRVRHMITDGRLTRRFGMFRFSKEAHNVLEDIPSSIRRRAEQQIERIIAPEEDVEFIRPPRDHNLNLYNKKHAADVREDENHQRREYEDRDHSRKRIGKNTGESTNYSNGRYLKRRREEDYDDVPEHNRHAELWQRNSKESAVDEFNNNYEETRRKSRNGMYESGYRPYMPARQVSDTGGGTVSSQNGRSDGVHSDLVSPVSRDNSQRGDSCSTLRRFAAACGEIIQTPGRNSSQESSIDDCGGIIPFPSKTLVTRVLAAMPKLSLRDDQENRYSIAATDLLFGSIQQKEDSDALLQTFLNKTSTLHCNELTQDHRQGDESHEHLFQPDTPLVEDLGSSSPPPTPALERQFNQTMMADREFVRSPESYDSPAQHYENNEYQEFSRFGMPEEYAEYHNASNHIGNEEEDEEEENDQAVNRSLLKDQRSAGDYAQEFFEMMPNMSPSRSISPLMDPAHSPGDDTFFRNMFASAAVTYSENINFDARHPPRF